MCVYIDFDHFVVCAHGDQRSSLGPLPLLMVGVGGEREIGRCLPTSQSAPEYPP